MKQRFAVAINGITGRILSTPCGSGDDFVALGTLYYTAALAEAAGERVHLLPDDNIVTFDNLRGALHDKRRMINLPGLEAPVASDEPHCVIMKIVTVDTDECFLRTRLDDDALRNL